MTKTVKTLIGYSNSSVTKFPGQHIHVFFLSAAAPAAQSTTVPTHSLDLSRYCDYKATSVCTMCRPQVSGTQQVVLRIVNTCFLCQGHRTAFQEVDVVTSELPFLLSFFFFNRQRVTCVIHTETALKECQSKKKSTHFLRNVYRLLLCSQNVARGKILWCCVAIGRRLTDSCRWFLAETYGIHSTKLKHKPDLHVPRNTLLKFDYL